MQQRHTNRKQYFEELAITSEKYFIPYISQSKKIEKGMRILEIGCGDGGNLLPFARIGCKTVGIDISEGRIHDAKLYFKEKGFNGDFITSDIFLINDMKNMFNIIICHDVMEHIHDKKQLLQKLSEFLTTDGIVFVSFPAWQMPFGGHQQLCKNRLLSHFPFLHLFPNCIYKWLLKRGGETAGLIDGLIDIKATKCPIELFQRVVQQTSLKIVDRRLYFINPHYEVKFGLKPKKLSTIFGCIPYIRDFFTTTCFYILKQ